LLDRTILREKLRTNIEEKNQLLRQVYGSKGLDVDAIIAEYVEFDKKIDPFVTDTSLFLSDAIKRKSNPG